MDSLFQEVNRHVCPVGWQGTKGDGVLFFSDKSLTFSRSGIVGYFYFIFVFCYLFFINLLIFTSVTGNHFTLSPE